MPRAFGITGLRKREDTVLEDLAMHRRRISSGHSSSAPGSGEHSRRLETSKPLQDVAARLNKGKFQRVVLTGMGSSFHALHPLNLELISHGITALMVETSELVHYKNRFFDPKTLIIAVSQSGQSAEMVRLAQTNHKRCTVIAVTNTPDSPLAKHANAAVFTQAGNEFSVSCKTYVTALMALKWLGDVLCERDLRRTRRELKEAALRSLPIWRTGRTMFAPWLRCSRIRVTCFWLAVARRLPPSGPAH